MPAPLSVVMPVLNAAPGLARSLPALGEGLADGLIAELVLSDGGSRDDTARIAEAAGAVWTEGTAGRGAQIARGIAASKSPWVLILHADSVLAPGWSPAVIAALADPGRARYGDLAFDVDGVAARCVAGWANLRSRMLGLPYGDQGLLVHKDLLERVGGYPDLPLMEDVALARALGRRLVPLGVTVQTSAVRYETDGWIRRGGRNLALLARYFAGADPARLAADYAARRAPGGRPSDPVRRD